MESVGWSLVIKAAKAPTKKARYDRAFKSTDYKTETGRNVRSNWAKTIQKIEIDGALGPVITRDQPTLSIYH